MNGGYSQHARLLADVEAHRVRPFADRLPPRDVEAEAVKAWRAVDTLTTASTAQLAPCMGQLLEIQERISLAIARAKGEL